MKGKNAVYWLTVQQRNSKVVKHELYWYIYCLYHVGLHQHMSCIIVVAHEILLLLPMSEIINIQIRSQVGAIKSSVAFNCTRIILWKRKIMFLSVFNLAYSSTFWPFNFNAKSIMLAYTFYTIIIIWNKRKIVSEVEWMKYSQYNF